MISLFVMPKDARDIISDYSYDEQILHLWLEVKVYSLEDVEVSYLENEDMVILKACSLSERVTTYVSYNPPYPNFYLYPHFIKDMGVIFPCFHLSMDVIRVLMLHLINCSLTLGVSSEPLRWIVKT